MAHYQMPSKAETRQGRLSPVEVMSLFPLCGIRRLGLQITLEAPSTVARHRSVSQFRDVAHTVIESFSFAA